MSNLGLVDTDTDFSKLLQSVKKSHFTDAVTLGWTQYL